MELNARSGPPVHEVVADPGYVPPEHRAARERTFFESMVIFNDDPPHIPGHPIAVNPFGAWDE